MRRRTCRAPKIVLSASIFIGLLPTVSSMLLSRPPKATKSISFSNAYYSELCLPFVKATHHWIRTCNRVPQTSSRLPFFWWVQFHSSRNRLLFISASLKKLILLFSDLDQSPERTLQKGSRFPLIDAFNFFGESVRLNFDKLGIKIAYRYTVGSYSSRLYRSL